MGERFYRTLFRLTPARWIVNGCNSPCRCWRCRWGGWITAAYGEASETETPEAGR